MSATAVSVPGSKTNLGPSSLSSEASSLPLWNRLSAWASENKAVIYTIAGVAVVVSGAGVAYYLSDSRKGPRDTAAEEKKRLSKKDRRKAKLEKENGTEKKKTESKEAPEEAKEHSKQQRYIFEPQMFTVLKDNRRHQHSNQTH